MFQNLFCLTKWTQLECVVVWDFFAAFFFNKIWLTDNKALLWCLSNI